VVVRTAKGDLSHGCTAFLVTPEASADGSTFVGQTWDMFSEAEREVIGLRIKVNGEPGCFAVGYAGCVGMMGMNAEGVAVAANNLRPNDARPGVPWTIICRAILAAASAEEAYRELTRARLCSGHNFIIADGDGAGFAVETTGTRFARIDPDEPTLAHANHYVTDLKDAELPLDPKGSSPHRERRMRDLLRGGVGSIDRPFLESALRDHDGRPRSICAHDYRVTSGVTVRSCGAIIMNCTARALAVIKGNPCKGAFTTVQL